MSETTTVTAPSPEAKAKLYAALARLQASIPKVVKGSTADTGTYKYQYAGLDAVTDAAMPALGKQGLAFIAMPTLNDEGKFVLAYSLVHEAGGEISGEYPLMDKGSPQQIGSAITYARRYALCAATGIAPGGDDDDAQAANQVHDYSGPSRRQQWQDRRPMNQGPRQERPARPAADRPAASREQAAGAAPRCPEGLVIDGVPFQCVKPGGHLQRPEDLLCRDERGREWASPSVPARAALDPEDPWQIAIDGAVSAEDTAKIRKELADTYAHDDPRVPLITAAISAREAALKPAGGERESTFVRTFRARIAAGVDETARRSMRIEIAKAVSTKTITPDEGNALNAALRDQVASAA